MLQFTTAPKNICILRLSAIGDICHTLPVIRTIQKHWPQTKITWIIGKTEYELLRDISDINFIVFDKKAGFKEYFNLRQHLKNQHFDVLLHMQMSIRASLISLFINSNYKIGFDRNRAKDAQWLFTNVKIKAVKQQHVMESLFGFSEILGIKQDKLRWDIPVSKAAHDSARKLLGDVSKYIIISPCSSKAYRNWHINGYAALIDYIQNKYNIDVVLTGGNSVIELEYGKKIIQTCTCKRKPLNLIAKTNLKELLSVINGGMVMISPDSGPAHMATAMSTPVIGLYATTNPERARPYLSSDWVVNRYPDAVEKKYHKLVKDVRWGTRVRDDWVMNLITTKDVKNIIDQFLQKYIIIHKL